MIYTAEVPGQSVARLWTLTLSTYEVVNIVAFRQPSVRGEQECRESEYQDCAQRLGEVAGARAAISSHRIP